MILVTGASGFIGANLCARLVADGVRFRALVRSREKARKRGIPDEAIVVGDLFANLDSVVVGVSAVVHLAGLVRASSAKELERVNAMGTANLMRALAELAPEARTVVVSSLAAAGPSADGSGTAVAPEAAHPVSAYGRSKRAAELGPRRRAERDQCSRVEMRSRALPAGERAFERAHLGGREPGETLGQQPDLLEPRTSRSDVVGGGGEISEQHRVGDDTPSSGLGDAAEEQDRAQPTEHEH